MIILVYTKFNSSNIQDNLGASEYSYYFVLNKFLPVLREIGQVHIIENPSTEVDKYYERALKDGLKCVFLCFTAPHNSFIDLKCPTIPVFAWEYDTIPNERWDGNDKNNWVWVLKKLGTGITHSNHSIEVFQREMGNAFPIIACPAPLEEHYFSSKQQIVEKNPFQQFEFTPTKEVIDSANLHFGQLSSEIDLAERIRITHVLWQKWSHEVLEDLLPWVIYRFLRKSYLFMGTLIARSMRFLNNLKTKTAKPARKNSVDNEVSSVIASGIIYTSVLNVTDSRKNYQDMVAGFCHALNDKSDATLILKTTVTDDLYLFKEKVLGFLQLLPMFKCRIVIIGYYLNNNAYHRLMKASTFYVNTSFGEGQCLPLMEYMAAGVPAIAPQSAALGDYVSSSNSFVLDTCAAPTYWQHDERRAIRTVHHQPDWYSLVEAYRASYQMAKNAPEAYREMALNASFTLKNHSSFQQTKEKLAKFLQQKLKA